MNSRRTEVTVLQLAMVPAFFTTIFAVALVILATSVGSAVAGQVSTGKSQAPKDIVDTATAAGEFATLLKAVEAADLVQTLKGDGPYTVFAPTDAAFAKVPADTMENLLADKDSLVAVLTYHVVPGRVAAADVIELSSAKTLQGQSVRIVSSDGVAINDAKVVAADIEASNGIIHVIDTVLMPEKR